MSSFASISPPRYLPTKYIIDCHHDNRKPCLHFIIWLMFAIFPMTSDEQTPIIVILSNTYLHTIILFHLLLLLLLLLLLSSLALPLLSFPHFPLNLLFLCCSFCPFILLLFCLSFSIPQFYWNRYLPFFLLLHFPDRLASKLLRDCGNSGPLSSTHYKQINGRWRCQRKFYCLQDRSLYFAPS